MPYPSPITYPSALTFPGSGVAGSLSPVGLGDLVLGAVDRNGCRWVLKDFDGWPGSPAPTLELTQRARGHGATSNEPFLTPRNMVLSGRVMAPTPEALNASLHDASAAVTLDDFVLTVSESGTIYNCLARRSGEVLLPKVNNLLARFSIQIVAKDPRKFGDLITLSTRLPFSEGGLIRPSTWPRTWTGVSGTGKVTVNNPGNTEAPVWLRIDGPIPAGGHSVTHLGKKRTLTFGTSLSLAAGEFLTVDMDKREVLAQGQSARSGYVTSRGWFTLDPGDNEISFAAVNYSATASLSLTTKPAWS